MALTQEISSCLIVVIVGTLSGIGGGIIRDVLVQNTPLVFKKDIYAIAAILGSIVFWATNYYTAGNLSLYLCFFTTLLIRLITIYGNINLPVRKEVITEYKEVSKQV